MLVFHITICHQEPWLSF